VSELARLEARIRALGQLSEVVRAMRGMASSRLHEAEAAAGAAEAFAAVIVDAVDLLAAASDGTEDPAGREGRSAPVLLLVTAEHGFVGGFSEQLARRAAHELRPGERLHVVGQRGAAIAAEHGLRAEVVHARGSHVEGVVAAAREVVRHLALPSGLRIVHPRPEPGGATTRTEEVLPRVGARRASRSLPLLHLPPPLLYRALLEELVFATVVRAMLDAFAAENDARLRAMERAERNIRDRVAELARERHRLRQEAITGELLDIVSGAEAVGPER
jgi:F-type H+-transporting ATPase subunit gamma